MSLQYLVLRPSKSSALERVGVRDGTTELSGADVMFDQFADLSEFEAHVIDSDDAVVRVLDRCRAALHGGGLGVARQAWVDDRWPVSVKGVLGWDNRVVVLRNERGEWELPGGRLDADDEDPESALRREMLEELGLDVEVCDLLDSWVYDVEGKRVLIVTYRCQASRPTALVHSDELSEVELLGIEELRVAPIPAGYLRAVRSALR